MGGKNYAVKEIYYTLQGEGAHTGRPAVFCRFAGCNLWSGHEEDRASAVCRFCDTDFLGVDGSGGGMFADPTSLVSAVASHWPPGEAGDDYRIVVCTGGEPLLQLDQPLIEEMHFRGFRVAVETNGTLRVPEGVDWICVSPKWGAVQLQLRGDELKLVFPQSGAGPEMHEHLAFDHFYLQPMDGPQRTANTELAIRYCLEHPRWKLSLQCHKYLGLR
jgi:7-carboxy-7-deazaguanine synthase